MAGQRPPFEPPTSDAAVFVISVAAELSGLHPQTLRTYERMGLISPNRADGGGRRYSFRDVELLREISELTSAGIGIEGVRQILDLQQRVAALVQRNQELAAELEATRDALRTTLRSRETEAAPNKLPVLREPPPSPGQPGQSVVVWRRGR